MNYKMNFKRRMLILSFCMILITINLISLKNLAISTFVIGIDISISIELLCESIVKRKFMKELGFRKNFDLKNRFNLKTKVGEYEISTVNLGIDHSFGIGKPLYYETMIFKGDDYSEKFDYQERYSTKEEARQGHEKAVKFVENKINKEEI